MLGLIGTKVGMTRIFTDNGEAIAVTVLAVGSNRVSQQKNMEGDGYNAVQLAFGEKRASRLTAPLKGHLAKHQAGAARYLHEFRNAELPEGKDSGDEIGADIFTDGQFVDVVGVTRGKGFAGVIKRHHFSSNRATHGNSRSHRKPGSTGQCQDPGRVFPGKKMPGRLGGKQRTAQNLCVVRVDTERNLLLIGGAIPGSPGNRVVVRPSVKRRGSK
ncbi:MAG: 50S ribosomal protein L3 [Gammaproteobacteria bacterium WSBS_2016_MAG_OTU1]